MEPEEIVAEINRKNRSILFARNDCENLSSAQVLALMDAAAVQGFHFGGAFAMSTVKGVLLLKQVRAASAKEQADGQA